MAGESGAAWLGSRYAALLRVHLNEGGEESLRLAYELGREAIAAGVGVVELAMVHQQALAEVLVSSIPVEPGSRHLLESAGAVLAEAISPFEMLLRGYQEANQSLRSLNAELSKAKEAAEAANQELEAFSYSVAHDLRAPLRAVDGFSRALLEDCAEALDATGKNHLQRVRNAAQRMAQLIDDLLRLSRVGRADLKPAPVDLSRLAETVSGELQRADPARKVQVVIAPGVVAPGDAHLLRVALENLIGNAWKFTSKVPSARVEFGVDQRDGQPVYFVRDNGAGFDQAYAGRLFAPFQRLHHESEFPGTGIGLATVQRIVRRHGGKIWAEGKVGEGATILWTMGT